LIAIPEIKAFRIKKEHDFIVLGCDGIFDRIDNKEAISVVWNTTKDLERLYPTTKTVH
jgi:serine/threonine protein phosphatase PrpC